MARDERMKTNNDVVDAMHQVFENTSQRNKPGQERNQVCKTMNWHNEWWQEKMARDKRMKTNNDMADAAPGVQEHKSAQQARAREEPGVQDSAQQSAAREEPGVQECKSAQ